jgi:hypothetical protein
MTQQLLAFVVLFGFALTGSDSFTQTKRPPIDDEFEHYVRSVFRNDIVHCSKKVIICREADDDDLKTWLDTFSEFTSNGTDHNGILRIHNIQALRSKLGNGFGTPEPMAGSLFYLLPPGALKLGEVYVVGAPGSDFDEMNYWLKYYKEEPISNDVSIFKYEPLLRRRMDADASGKVSEDEFVKYVVINYNYKPISPAKFN